MRTLGLLLICSTMVFLAGCDEPTIRSKAEAGDTNLQYNLGVMYAEGKALPKDSAEAVKWFRMAAKLGLAEAQTYLGFMYENGEGVAKDSAEAVKWYRKAADQGYATAQYNLGFMYRNGEGVPKDEAEAYAWYNIAAVSYDNARKTRDELEKTLTPEQKARAQQRSTELHNQIEARKKAGK